MALSRTASDASMEEEDGEEPLPASHSHVGPDLGALHDALDHPPAVMGMQVRTYACRWRKAFGDCVCASGALKLLSAVEFCEVGTGTGQPHAWVCSGRLCDRCLAEVGQQVGQEMQIASARLSTLQQG